MTDARFPERWLNDARLQRVSPGAYRLFGNGLMWTVANRTDGHLPVWSLGLISHATEADAKELSSVSLWLDHPSDGWVVADFEATQTTKADLDHLAYQRQRTRDRKRRERARRDVTRDQPRDGPRDVHADTPRTGQARTGALRGTGNGDLETASDPWDHVYQETAS